MERREFLSIVGAGSPALICGCVSLDGATTGSNCPENDIEDNISYETRDPGSVLESWEAGIELVTSADQIGRFGDAPTFDADDKRWVTGTDFSEAVIVGIQVATGGDESNSPFQISGIERETGDTVHVYSCLAKLGAGDAAYQYARLLRVRAADPQESPSANTHIGKRERYRRTKRTIQPKVDTP